MNDVPNGHQPKIYSATPDLRIFAEPETQGEAYIPLANDRRRPRAKSIADETVRRLGGQVQWNANGALRAAQGIDAASVRSSAPPAPSLIGATITGSLRINGNVATIEDARIVAQQEIARDADTQGVRERAGGR